MRGEAGSGKTRLLAELRAYCDVIGTMFLQGRCYGPTVPYSPWTEAINECFGSYDAQTLKALCRGRAAAIFLLVPSLRGIVEKESGRIGLIEWLKGPNSTSGQSGSHSTAFEDETGRLGFLEGVTQFLINMSKKRALVVSLDDLQDADTATLILLRYVTRHIFDNRIVLIGSFREELVGSSHPLRQLVLELEKEDLAQSVRLAPLVEQEILPIVRGIITDNKLTEHVASTICSVTRGNPYFVLETLRSLEERGIIGPNFVDPGRLQSSSLPSNAKSLIKQKLDGLDPDCTELLTIGAVMGPEFGYDLLQATANISEETMLRHLETGLKTGLLRERKSGNAYRFEFADPRVRSVLYEDLSAVRRRKLHFKIGQMIEKTFAQSLTDSLAQVAYHYLQAGELEKASHYSNLAAERAASIHAYDEAVRHYKNIVELGEYAAAKEAEAKVKALQRSIENWNHALEKAALMVDVEQYNECSEQWETVVVPLLEPLAKKLVEMAQLRKGQKVLDIGTGTGLAAFLAADIVGPQGRVIGIDLSEGMLRVGTEKCQKFGYKNLEFQKMDEASMRLPSDSFDSVICHLGLTNYNVDRAFEEVHRVLKRGCLLTFNEFTERGEDSKPEEIFRKTMLEYRTRSPSELLVAAREAATYTQRGYSRVTNSGILHELLEHAGFREISHTTVEHSPTIPTVEGVLEVALAWWTTSLEVTEMSPENRDKFFRTLKQSIGSLQSPEGVVLDWEFNYFTALK